VQMPSEIRVVAVLPNHPWSFHTWPVLMSSCHASIYCSGYAGSCSPSAIKIASTMVSFFVVIATSLFGVVLVM